MIQICFKNSSLHYLVAPLNIHQSIIFLPYPPTHSKESSNLNQIPKYMCVCGGGGYVYYIIHEQNHIFLSYN